MSATRFDSFSPGFDGGFFPVSAGVSFDPLSLRSQFAGSEGKRAVQEERDAGYVTPEPNEVFAICEEFKTIMINYTALKAFGKPGVLSKVAYDFLSESFYGTLGQDNKELYVLGMEFNFKGSLSSVGKLNAIYDVVRLVKCSDPALYEKFMVDGQHSYWSRWTDISKRFLIQRAAINQNFYTCKIAELTEENEKLRASLLEFQNVNQSAREQMTLHQSHFQRQHTRIVELEQQLQLFVSEQSSCAQRLAEQALLLNENGSQLHRFEEALVAARQQLAAQAALLQAEQEKSQNLMLEQTQLRRERDQAQTAYARAATVNAQYDACLPRGGAYAIGARQTIRDTAGYATHLEASLANARAVIETTATQMAHMQAHVFSHSKLTAARLKQRLYVDRGRAHIVNSVFRRSVQNVIQALNAQEKMIRSSWILWFRRSKRKTLLTPVLECKERLNQIAQQLMVVSQDEDPNQAAQVMRKTARHLTLFLEQAVLKFGAISGQSKRIQQLLPAIHNELQPALLDYQRGSAASAQSCLSGLDTMIQFAQDCAGGMSAQLQSALPLLDAARQNLGGVIAGEEALKAQLDCAEAQGAFLFRRSAAQAEENTALVPA